MIRRGKRQQITTTISPEAGGHVALRAHQERTTVSAMIERYILRDKQEYDEQLMREGYLEMQGKVPHEEWPGC